VEVWPNLGTGIATTVATCSLPEMPFAGNVGPPNQVTWAEAAGDLVAAVVVAVALAVALAVVVVVVVVVVAAMASTGASAAVEGMLMDSDVEGDLGEVAVEVASVAAVVPALLRLAAVAEVEGVLETGTVQIAVT